MSGGLRYGRTTSSIWMDGRGTCSSRLQKLPFSKFAWFAHNFHMSMLFLDVGGGIRVHLMHWLGLGSFALSEKR